MVDIEELIRELKKAVEVISCQDWNPQKLTTESLQIEYADLIHNVTIFTITHIKSNELENDLLTIEKNLNGVAPSIDRCNSIAKKLRNKLDSTIAKLHYKGMRERREKMNAALKEFTIPFIKKHGFKGTSPNFTRKSENKTISLKFQFSQFSSQFTVELCSSTPERRTLRLGSIKNKYDYWYDFEKSGQDSFSYKLIAEEVIKNWDEAEN